MKSLFLIFIFLLPAFVSRAEETGPPKETLIQIGIADIAKKACDAMEPAPQNCERDFRAFLRDLRAKDAKLTAEKKAAKGK